jgi:hypothetical protein
VAAAPVPGPAEALSSWLDRTARLYGLRPQACCAIISGSAAFTLPGRGDLDLGWDPPRTAATLTWRPVKFVFI